MPQTPYQKEWVKNNPDKIKGYQKTYKDKHGKDVAKKRSEEYFANKEKHQALHKIYYAKNKERYKSYYLKNKEKISNRILNNKEAISIYSKAYYIKNKIKMNVYSEAYYLKNKEKIKARSKAWYYHHNIYDDDYYDYEYYEDKDIFLIKRSEYYPMNF